MNPEEPEPPRILNLNRPRRPEIPEAAQHDENEMIGFQVHRRRWSSIKAIMAEMDLDEQILARALKEGHGIEFDTLRQDPFLFYVVSQYQTEGLRRAGVVNPTHFQLIGSSECWATSAEECERKYRELKA